ncbi:MAG: response regulator transcription factor, partial [Ktedonobacteraceae bacterium]|nr:response regulator transcription factor [Ktedonobacteraceae bacterium]
PYGTLTKREREVLMLMCLGHDQKTIADRLCISPTTVGKHRQHIYEQLNVHNEHDALLAAYHLGFFSILEQVSQEYYSGE